MKTVFITGASAGIGLATSVLLSEKSNEYQLILNGRRLERLEEIAHDLNSKYQANVKIAHFDVRNYEDVKLYFENLEDNIDILINNAGLASGRDLLHEADVEDWNKMIDTNIKGLLYVSRMVLPKMVENKSGHVINIGSIAGKEVYAGGGVYCASKFAVEAITQAMRKELLPHKIRVSLVSPGAVLTEFSLVRYHGDIEKSSNVYKGFEPLSPENVASAILYAIEAPKNVNIQDIFIMPEAQADGTTIRKEI
jgi:3-hydroxy acid dehydrogenase / malonic semialdehyde reductase